LKKNVSVSEKIVSVWEKKNSALIPLPKFNPGFGSRYQYQISQALTGKQKVVLGCGVTFCFPVKV
jgi:hypothetical protein